VVRDIGQPAGAAPLSADPDAADPDLDLLRRRLGNVLGHALRTPVATVRGLVESIEPTGDDVVVHREVLDSLHRSAARLEQLVDDLLLVSGLETGLPTGPHLELRLLDEIERVVADQLELPLELEVEGADGAVVRAQPDALRWLLRCVLDNAARYGDGRASVDVELHDDRVLLAVATGPEGAGATDHDLVHATEPFYRGERAVLTDGARLGVGLAVAARLADEIGGEVAIRRGERDTIVTVLELPRP
jgi:two-component system phosphate regulon sensor histidine kinase PhoR